MPAAKPELRAECVRLRVEERMSFREIAEVTGASKGSLSLWLRDHPLTEAEKKAKRERGRKGGNPKKDRGVESEIHRVVRSNNLNGIQVAKVSETAVLLRLLSQGFNPFGSMFDGDKADWLVEIPQTGKIWKVQVKTARWLSSGLPTVELSSGAGHRNGRKRYQQGDFDFIVGFDLYTDTAYVWSWGEVEHLKTSVTICPEAEEKWEKLIGV